MFLYFSFNVILIPVQGFMCTESFIKRRPPAVLCIFICGKYLLEENQNYEKICLPYFSSDKILLPQNIFYKDLNTFAIILNFFFSLGFDISSDFGIRVSTSVHCKWGENIENIDLCLSQNFSYYAYLVQCTMWCQMIQSQSFFSRNWTVV